MTRGGTGKFRRRSCCRHARHPAPQRGRSQGPSRLPRWKCLPRGGFLRARRLCRSSRRRQDPRRGGRWALPPASPGPVVSASSRSSRSSRPASLGSKHLAGLPSERGGRCRGRGEEHSQSVPPEPPQYAQLGTSAVSAATVLPARPLLPSEPRQPPGLHTIINPLSLLGQHPGPHLHPALRAGNQRGRSGARAGGAGQAAGGRQSPPRVPT